MVRKDRRIIARRESIDFFEGGVKITVPATVDLPHHGIRGERGKVKGWSTASRRRMREFMLEHQPIEGREPFGVTLTVPGPNPTPQESAKLFDHFTKHYLTRNGCGMVWRLEVQARGAVHWHGLLSAPRGVPLNGIMVHIRVAVTYWWLAALRVLGKTNHDSTFAGRPVTWTDVYRDQIPGAEFHACQLQEEGGRGAWMRYLQDHATKAKQEQIAEGYGRHWGVTGRAYFQRSRPIDSRKFSSVKTFSRFLRAYQRLTRPVMSWKHRRAACVKFQSRPFAGRSLGWSTSRGSRGVSVWFSRPETVKRLVEWAESTPAPAATP